MPRGPGRVRQAQPTVLVDDGRLRTWPGDGAPGGQQRPTTTAPARPQRAGAGRVADRVARTGVAVARVEQIQAAGVDDRGRGLDDVALPWPSGLQQHVRSGCLLYTSDAAD